MTTYRVVGKPTPSLEGPDKVSGAATFAVDASLPGMLWCRVLRSPYPHASILAIDTSKARALPGVHAVLTGDDVRGMRTGNEYHDEPVLAWDEVRYVGDKVAAVCAEGVEIAERALALIDVRYQELPAVLTAEEAIRGGAVIVHPDLNMYAGVEPLATPSNVYGSVSHTVGDVKQGFAEADVVVERTYRTPRTHQLYLEPHTCLVSVQADGGALVWFASGIPGPNRDEVARVLGLPPDRIVVHFSYLGGSYGGKTDGADVILCYLLSRAAGRPVKYTADYTEELTAMHPRHPADIRITAGAKRDGTLTAWEAEIYFTTGAYAAYALVPRIGGIIVADVAGPYRTPNVRVDSYQVYTHTIACGYARGPGPVQCAFACESHIDAIARELGLSPVELRRKNLIATAAELPLRGSWSPTVDPAGRERQDVRMAETLDAALDAAGYSDPKPEGVGRGIAVAVHGEIGGDGHAAVSVQADGTVGVSMPSFGPGIDTYTTLAQVVAEELGVPMDRVRAVPWSSAEGPTDIGLGGDRGARITTLAGSRACDDLKQRLRTLAAELLGWEEAAIHVSGGHVVNETVPERVPIAAIAAQKGEPITGRGDVDEPLDTAYASFAAHVAEVSVDRETGQVQVLRYTAAHETGRVLNPVGFHGQINGGVQQGLGHALMEELPLVDGRVSVATLADYKSPVMPDMPPLTTVVLDSLTGHGPYNVRGIGNKSITLPAPAIANAIADACGARVNETPLTAERVLAALREEATG